MGTTMLWCQLTLRNSIFSTHMTTTMLWCWNHSRNSLIRPTWPQPCHSCSMSSSEYLKVFCCPTYRPQPIEHVRETTLWITHRNAMWSSQYEHSSYVPRLPNSSANCWGGQSIWTHPYWPQQAHSHRQHSQTRATTQEFLVFFCYLEPQLKGHHSEPQLRECHVFNPYPEPQLKGYILSHNSRNTNKPTFEVS